VRKDKDSFVNGLAMQALALLDENHDTADTKGSGKNTKTDQETSDNVTDDETADSTANGSCSPVDIPALQAHHLQRSLKTLEDGEILIVGLGIHQTRTTKRLLTTDAEEQRQSLGCGDQEDTGTDEHHDALLDILLLVVHLNVHGDRTDNGNYTGNGITQLDGNRHVPRAVVPAE